MLYLNIHEVKTHLSKYLERVAAGERILICKRNIPIAELRGLPIPLNNKRPVGLAKGEFIVTDRFFDPLPEDMIDTFNGH